MVTPLLHAVVCFNGFTLQNRIHTSSGACPPPQHLAAIDALLRFCAVRCNAKRPHVLQPALRCDAVQPALQCDAVQPALQCDAVQPALRCDAVQPAGFSGAHLQSGDVWETDALADEEDGSGFEAGLEMDAADDAGDHYPFPWDDGPFVADDMDDAAAPCPAHYSSDQFSS